MCLARKRAEITGDLGKMEDRDFPPFRPVVTVRRVESEVGRGRHPGAVEHAGRDEGQDPSIHLSQPPSSGVSPIECRTTGSSQKTQPTIETPQ